MPSSTPTVETVLADFKRHRDGMAAATKRLLECQGHHPGGLPPQDRRSALKTLRAARLKLDTLEQALTAVDGEGSALKS